MLSLSHSHTRVAQQLSIDVDEPGAVSDVGLQQVGCGDLLQHGHEVVPLVLHVGVDDLGDPTVPIVVLRCGNGDVVVQSKGQPGIGVAVMEKKMLYFGAPAPIQAILALPALGLTRTVTSNVQP